MIFSFKKSNDFLRFDVAGIHPKSKTPGTITQVAYDKKCMSEVVSQSIEDSTITLKKFSLFQAFR